MERELIQYRLDDLPLLYSIVKSLNISKSVNKHIQVHGNWSGTLPGEILELWLCYMLSCCDHRLSGAEEWAKKNLDFLRILSGLSDLSPHDFSDDKLGQLLGYFSIESSWRGIESDVNGQVLGVYRLEQGDDLATFRLDAAPMQSYGSINEGGLLQRGYHKHHPNLGQFKVKLCTLDNSVNHFAYPVCHLTVPGNVSDDGLYTKVIAKTKLVLADIKAYARGNLFVGDSKFGSQGNRLYVVTNGDYYLMPLPLLQLSQAARRAAIDASPQAYKQVHKKVLKSGKSKDVLVAEGFELTRDMEGIDQQGKTHKWEERLVYVHSVKYARAQEHALENRLTKTQKNIEELTQRKQGKRVLKTKQALQDAVNNILKTNQVREFLKVTIKETQTIKKVGAYGGRPAREEVQSAFELVCQREESLILTHKKYLGWQVYATNAPEKLLSFEKCVWKYRYQSNIESRFDDLRNKLAALLPVFLQKDERIKGLVSVLLLALKICSIMEFKVAKALQESGEKLYNIYEGNPKRGSDRPSTIRILNAFKGISIAVIFEGQAFQFAIMTKLTDVQIKIIELLQLNTAIYNELSHKTQLFFSKKKIIET